MDEPRVTAAPHAIWVRRIAVIAVWAAILVGWRAYLSSTGEGVVESAQRFVDAVGGAWWGVLAYLAVYLVRPLVLFPATLLTIAGGLLFGPVGGVAVVIVGANASALVAYGVGRMLGRAPSGDGEVDSLAARWAGRMRTSSFETVLLMRLLFLPYDLVNYLSGVLRVRWVPFLLATAIGSLPGTVSFVLLGASIEQLDEGLGGISPTTLVASVVLIVASLVVARVLRARRGGDPTELAEAVAAAS
ncbi:MAG TPA: VTT domain-containing protein [Acidimicrobiales bacterium]|nr:VTT domain-containing protein [Acidimicrobiales bacterium]